MTISLSAPSPGTGREARQHLHSPGLVKTVLSSLVNHTSLSYPAAADPKPEVNLNTDFMLVVLHTDYCPHAPLIIAFSKPILSRFSGPYPFMTYFLLYFMR